MLVCVRACVRACVRGCVRACVRVCVRADKYRCGQLTDAAAYYLE